jgi:hypothetical protein
VKTIAPLIKRHPPKCPEPLFVCVSDVHEGDVLLTRGTEKLSMWIAFFSRGRFSHAGIFVHPSMILEALGDVVDFEYLETGHATIEGRGRVRVVRIPHEPIHAEIWRHPKCTMSWSNFNEISYRVTKELYGKNYSLWVRVVRLMDRFALARPAVEYAARIVDWIGRKQSPVPGPFCSELVAVFFKHLQLNLFDPQRSPETVSPENLANSNLRRVDQIIVPASVLTDYTAELPDPREEERRKQSVENMNSFRDVEERERRRSVRLQAQPKSQVKRWWEVWK